MRGAEPRALRPRWAALVVAAFALSACIAWQNPSAVTPSAPGFWFGLWHGFIFPVAWIGSLFTDDIAVYAVPNNGGWYDFGFFLGVCVFGVGGGRAARGRR